MKLWPIIVLFLIPVLSWGQTFDDVVDFNLELSNLDNPAIVADAADSGRIAILEGLMGDSVIIQNDNGTEVWLNLVGGSWIGTEEVRSYACRILFRGESWVEVFPGERPREPSPNYIPQGSRLLVAARILGFDRETNQALAEMVDFRVLN